MTVKEKRDIKRKLNVIHYAKKTGNVNKACRHVVYQKLFIINCPESTVKGCCRFLKLVCPFF
jgi:hypothetical protein